MSSLLALDSGPCPIINRPYKSVRTTLRGKLSACADALGTLQLHFQASSGRSRRQKLVSSWRSGPLRSCPHMFDGLRRSLTLLGEEPSLEQTVRLSRRIDRRLSDRLTNFALASEGRYDLLASHVDFRNTTGSSQGTLPQSAWVIGRTEGALPIRELLPGNSLCGLTLRETYIVVRRLRAWELWARLERTDAGSIPSRRHVWLCSTELLHEEPPLAAELLLYALLRRRGEPIEVAPCRSGLIPPERLSMLNARLAAPIH